MDVEYRRAQAAVKFGSVLFPFDALRFAKLLMERGFILAQGLEEMDVPFEGRLNARGSIAKKGDLSIRLDTDKYVLAVHSMSPKASMDLLVDLESWLQNDLKYQLAKDTQYYELLVNGLGKASNSALAAIRKIQVGNFCQTISEIFGSRLSPIGIRLSTDSANANQEEWCDIRLQPHFPDTDSHYAFEIVFRTSDRGKLQTFVAQLEERLNKMVAALDKG